MNQIEVFPIGDFIAEELSFREWTTLDLAKMMRGDVAVNHLALELLLVDGTLLMDDQAFEDIAAAFGVSEKYLRNIDSAYKDHRTANKRKTAPAGGE